MSKLVEGEGAMAASQATLEAARSAASSAAGEGLVARCRAGDPEAFSRLVGLHEGMVVGLAARLLGDSEEARDLAQDVFLLVYRRLDRFEGRSSLKTWIYRIVVNQCRNRRRWWRRRRRDRAVSLDELSPAEQGRLGERAARGNDPLRELARRERAARVQRALLGLSFEHRAILLLRDVEGLTGEEAAAALGVPTGTVKSRLARAREAFRRRVDRSEGESS